MTPSDDHCWRKHGLGDYKCKGCQDRHPGCHDHCESYQQVKKGVDQKKNLIYKMKKPYKKPNYQRGV